MSEPILVLGMHRSGTSAVAGVLAKLGGRAPKNLMPAHPVNPRGFFESTPIWVFNDELLASAGSSWDDWRKFNPSWFDSAEAALFRQRAKDLVDSEFDGSSLPILKDPRICRFAPFWLDLFKKMGATPHIVVPVRSPLEVAQSLQEAQNVPLAKGLLLWLRHILDAEAFSRNEPRSIFSWNEFLSDWRGTVEKIGTEARLAWPRLSDRAGREIERFLGPELVHQRVSPAGLATHSKIHEWTLESYDAVLELARNPLSNSAIEKLNNLSEVFDRACAMFGPVLAEAEIDVEELSAKLVELSDERGKQNSQAADLHGALTAAQAESSRISGELAEAAGERERLAEALVNREADLVTAMALLTDARAAQEKLAGELAAAQAAREKLAAESAEAQAAREKLAADLAEAQAAREKLAAESAEAQAAREKLAADLAEAQAAREKLAADLAEAQAAREKLAIELAEVRAAPDLEERLSAATAELASNRAGVEMRAAQLGEQLQVALGERQRLAAKVRAMEEARRLTEKEAEARVSQLGAAHAASEQQSRAQVQALTSQLVEAEARLANTVTQQASVSTWKGLLSGRRHRDARLLLKSGLFDEEWYKNEYPEVANKGHSTVEHFLAEGYLRGYRPNPLFDPRWYLERYADVRRSGMNPVIHYIRDGAEQGRDPGPGFNTGFYLSANPDVRKAGTNPLAHYLSHGRHEGRRPVPRA